MTDPKRPTGPFYGDWPVLSILRELPGLDVAATCAAMRKLLLDHLARRASFDATQARFEMHPQTRHDLMAGIHALYGTQALLDATLAGEFKIDGVRVDGNPMLGMGVVRFIGAVTEGDVVRVMPTYDDERKR